MSEPSKNAFSVNVIHLIIGVLAAFIVVFVTDQPVLTLFIVLFFSGLALMIILARTGLVKPALLLALGFALIINPQKGFSDQMSEFGFSGAVMDYYIALSDLILIMLIGVMLKPEKTVAYQEKARLAGKFTFIALVVYLLWIMLSTLMAPNHSIAFTQWLYEFRQGVILVFMGFALARLPKAEFDWSIRLILSGVACALLFETGIVMLEYLGFMTQFSFMGIKVGSFDENLGGVVLRRVGGTFQHPNALAMPMATLLPLMAAKALDKRGGRWFQMLTGAAALGAALCLAMTMSRGAIVGLGGAIVICGLLFLTISGGMSFVRKNMRYFALAGVGLAVLALIFSGPIVRKFTESDPANLTSRLDMNKLAMEIIADYPFAGAGLNNSNVVGPQYSYYRLYEMLFKSPPVVHDVYLLVASEIGIFGLGLWLLLIFSAIFVGVKALYRPIHDFRDKLVLAALLVGVLTYLIADIVGYSMRLLQLGYLFWWELGLLFCLARRILNAPHEQGDNKTDL